MPDVTSVVCHSYFVKFVTKEYILVLLFMIGNYRMEGILSLLHQWKNWINLHVQRLSQVLYIHYNTIHIINSVIISLPLSRNSPKILVQQMYSA